MNMSIIALLDLASVCIKGRISKRLFVGVCIRPPGASILGSLFIGVCGCG